MPTQTWAWHTPLAATPQKQQPPAEKRGHAGEYYQTAANVVIEKECPDGHVQPPRRQRSRQPNDQAAARFGFGGLRHFAFVPNQ
jgi:hypothetical protein